MLLFLLTILPAIVLTVLPAPTHAISVEEFCVDRSLSQLQYGGTQATMVQQQASLVQDQANTLNAVALMQQIRGGQGSSSGDSMTRIMKTHAWETKGLRYSQSLVFFAGPPIALGIVFFFFWIITATCRCCDTIEFDVCCSRHCGNCCLPEKKLSEYTKCEKLCPVFTYIFLGLIASVCSILGLLYLLQVANSVTGMVCDVENFRSDTSKFLDNITVPLSNISTATTTAVGRVTQNVGNATFAQAHFNYTTENMTMASLYLKEYDIRETEERRDTLQQLPYAAPCNCTFCTATGKGLESTKQEMIRNLGSTLDDLIQLEQDVVNSVVNIGDQIKKTVSTASTNSYFLIHFVNVIWKEFVSLGMSSLSVVQTNVVLFATMFFGATLVSFVLTLIGLFFLSCGKYTNCTGTFLDDLDDHFGAWLVFLGWYVTGLVVIVMFVLSGVLVPLAVVFSDVCVVLDDFPSDMHAYLDKIIVPPTAAAVNNRRTMMMPSTFIESAFIESAFDDIESASTSSTSYNKRSLLEVASAASNGNSGNNGKPSIGPSPVDVFIGCYQKKKLLETLNMSQNFAFTTSLNFTSLNAVDEVHLNSIFNVTNANIQLTRQQMSTRRSSEPDFLCQKHAFPANTSSAAGVANCTLSAETTLKVSSRQLDFIGQSSMKMQLRTEKLLHSLRSIESELTPLIALGKECDVPSNTFVSYRVNHSLLSLLNEFV